MFKLRYYQEEAVAAVEREWAAGNKKTLIVLSTGCHAIGEKVLLANGRAERVENINVGDKLLGADGKPRNVLMCHEGEYEMYKITPVKGKPFLVTGNHKLTIVRNNKREKDYNQLVDITVEDYINKPDHYKHCSKLIRSSLIKSFNRRNKITIDPYFLGLLIGDGGLKYQLNITTADQEVVDYITKMSKEYGFKFKTTPSGKSTTYTFVYDNNWSFGVKGSLLHQQLKSLGLRRTTSESKFIPDEYKYSNYKTRLEILAGIIDTDGSFSEGCYDFVSKSKRLAEDVVFVCRSLGLAAYMKECVKKCQNNFSGTYYRVCISGDISIIPCKVKHKIAPKRKQIKDVLRTGFTVEAVGVQKYKGFTVDGDNRYLLDDFTITHNCGKTICFSSVAARRVAAGEKVLILAHRGELLEQAADKMKKACGLDSVLEKAESTAVNSNCPVVVASVQTLYQDKRLEAYAKDYFGTIIIDEAHHCMSSTYQKVLEYFSSAKVLGVTATPDRNDKRNLGHFFDSMAYEFGIRRAVDEKFLVRPAAQLIPLRLDISEVAQSNGDFAAGELGTALDPYLEEIADEMVVRCKGRKTIVFTPLVKTSVKFCEILNRKGFKAFEVNGESKDRKEKLTAFSSGEYNVAVNSMLWVEGFDEPSVDCIVVLRPTRSRSLYTQMIGRGLRLAPNKEDCLILDFLWLTERHDLCHPASIIAKDEDMARMMTERILAEGAKGEDSPVDLLGVEAAVEEDIIREREESLARQLSELRSNRAKFVDPLQYAFSIADESIINYEPTFAWEKKKPTQKQINLIQAWGLDVTGIDTVGKASALITALHTRKRQGLATPKLFRFLEGKGFKQVGTWKFDDANKMISAIADNRWFVPKGINAATYKPGQSNKPKAQQLKMNI